MQSSGYGLQPTADRNRSAELEASVSASQLRYTAGRNSFGQYSPPTLISLRPLSRHLRITWTLSHANFGVAIAARAA